MGFSTSSSKGSSRTLTNLAEINVTPLVDVVLVLLIIFMICAPLMQNGVQVDLPKTGATTLKDSNEPILLVLNRGNQVTLNGKPVPPGTLLARVQAALSSKPGTDVFIHADQGVPYGTVVTLMAELKRSGVARLGLVTDPSGGDAKSKF